jgi:hypothetical protein
MKRYTILSRNWQGDEYNELCQVETNPEAIAVGAVILGRAHASNIAIRDNDTGYFVPWGMPERKKRKTVPGESAAF